jgi:hypothetical protein
MSLTHCIRAVTNYYCHSMRVEKPRSFEDMEKKRLAADFMKNLGQS